MKRNKYKNRKTEINGILFDSKMEADYYLYLLDLQQQGIIAHFERQPVFMLLPSFKKFGKTFRKIEYKADFYVAYTDGNTTVIDVKGVSTPVFKLKAKLFHYFYPDLTLNVVTWKRGGWIELV